MSADDREPGFYWVRCHSRHWTVGEWRGGYEPTWEIVGSAETFSDDEMSEIGPRIEGEPEPI